MKEIENFLAETFEKTTKGSVTNEKDISRSTKVKNDGENSKRKRFKAHPNSLRIPRVVFAVPVKVQAEDRQVLGVARLNGHQRDERGRVGCRLELAINLEFHEAKCQIEKK